MSRTRRRAGIGVALVVLAFAWVTMGIGYSRMSRACYEARHSVDHEPEVYGGNLGVAINTVFWPLFQSGIAVGGIDCMPRPVAPLPAAGHD